MPSINEVPSFPSTPASDRLYMKRDIFMEAAFTFRKLSTCYRRAVGAIALDKYGGVVSIGYNGVPSGWPHCAVVVNGIDGKTEMPNLCPGANDQPGQTQQCFAEHAEQNLIGNCGDVHRIVTVYLTASPCKTCAVMLANLPNLEEIYYAEEYPDEEAIEVLKRAYKWRGITSDLWELSHTNPGYSHRETGTRR